MYFFNAEKYRRKEMYTLEKIHEPYLYILGHKPLKMEKTYLKTVSEVKKSVSEVNEYAQETTDKCKEHRRIYSLTYPRKTKDDIDYREKANEKARDIYHSLTPEEKSVVNKKKQDYIRRKNREKLADPVSAEILRQKWRDERKRRNDRIKNFI